MAARREQTALVTGASVGIGLELARVLAEEGFDLALVARRKDELSRLARELEGTHGIRASVHPIDLLREHAVAALQSELEGEGIAIDLLVNNAGVMEVGAFHELPLERLMGLLQLNAAVLTELLHRSLEPMVARRHGRILNVASLAAFQPVPSLALYAASKAFVLSLSESLSEELRGTGVTITALCPGLTRTQMVEQAKQANPLARAVPDFLISDSAKVAREGVEGCLSGRAGEGLRKRVSHHDVFALAQPVEEPVLVPGAEHDQDAYALPGALVEGGGDERVVCRVDVGPAAGAEIVVEQPVVRLEAGPDELVVTMGVDPSRVVGSAPLPDAFLGEGDRRAVLANLHGARARARDSPEGCIPARRGSPPRAHRNQRACPPRAQGVRPRGFRPRPHGAR